MATLTDTFGADAQADCEESATTICGDLGNDTILSSAANAQAFAIVVPDVEPAGEAGEAANAVSAEGSENRSRSVDSDTALGAGTDEQPSSGDVESIGDADQAVEPITDVGGGDDIVPQPESEDDSPSAGAIPEPNGISSGSDTNQPAVGTTNDRSSGLGGEEDGDFESDEANPELRASDDTNVTINTLAGDESDDVSTLAHGDIDQFVDNADNLGLPSDDEDDQFVGQDVNGETVLTIDNDDRPVTIDEAANLQLIAANPTRNTQFDNNRFRDVPMNQIAVSDLTVQGDIYNETLLNTDNSGFFRVKCEVSHFAYDDPIVHPGQPGAAHLHMFFGNTEANAYSTFDSLLNTGTSTCNGEDLNRTAYWTPALLDRDGNALIPFEIMVYYKNDSFRVGDYNELVSPFPDNLRMVAGNGGATSPQTSLTGGPGSIPAVNFLCARAYSSENVGTPLIPDCRGTGGNSFQSDVLEMRIAFPQCFNPASGTYLGDQNHMSYSEGGFHAPSCPDSHPEDVSSIMYRIFFDPNDYGGNLTDLHLSSDVRADQILPGGTTAHADWFGAWHPDAMESWVQNCNNTQADCEIGLLGRSPAVSLVERRQGFYPDGYRAPAEQLAALCPGSVFNPADPLRSVANCHHS